MYMSQHAWRQDSSGFRYFCCSCDTGFSETYNGRQFTEGKKVFGLSYSYFLYFFKSFCYDHTVLYNLYISICEKKKSRIFYSIYMHIREVQQNISVSTMATICSIAAMCLMWALDTKQTLIVEESISA